MDASKTFGEGAGGERTFARRKFAECGRERQREIRASVEPGCAQGGRSEREQCYQDPDVFRCGSRFVRGVQSHCPGCRQKVFFLFLSFFCVLIKKKKKKIFCCVVFFFFFLVFLITFRTSRAIWNRSDRVWRAGAECWIRRLEARRAATRCCLRWPIRSSASEFPRDIFTI